MNRHVLKIIIFLMDCNQISDQLFNFLQDRCSNSEHSGSAIYYCLQSTCQNRHLCTECLTENASHFSSHSKQFLPLDQKLKFQKYLNLNRTEIKLTKEINSEEILSSTRSKIENYLSRFENEVLQLLSELKSETVLWQQTREKEISPKFQSSVQGEEDQINTIINTLINSNSKENFPQAYEEIKKTLLRREEKIAQINNHINNIQTLEIPILNKDLFKKFMRESFEDNLNNYFGVVSKNNITLNSNPSRLHLHTEETNLDNNLNWKKETEGLIQSMEEISTPSSEKNNNLKQRLEALRQRMKDK